MTITVTRILQDAYKALGELNHSKATSGSTTTIVDSALANAYPDGNWNKGTVFVVRDAGGASAAPEGEFARVTTFAGDTATWTLADTLTAAVAANDWYAWAGGAYPVLTMVELLNQVLREMGELPLVGTTLTTVAGQTEYTLPANYNDQTPLRVDIATVSDADDNQWLELRGWEFVPAATGGTGKLILDEQPAVGWSLRVWYRDIHPAVFDFDDTLHETLNTKVVTAKLVQAALGWKKKRRPGDVELIRDLNTASEIAANAEVQYPRWEPTRRDKLFLGGGRRRWDDDYISPP